MKNDKYKKMQEDIIYARKRNQCINISAELTPICNFDCPMCYVKQYTNVEGMLKTQEWIDIFDEAIKSGVKYVLLTGGEVLTYPGFYEIVQFLDSKGIDVRIKTNGYYIDDVFLDFISKHSIYLCDISIYGYDKDSYYYNTGVDAFEILYNNVQRLVKAKTTRVRIMITNSYGNIVSAKKLLSFVKQFGCEVIVNETPLFPPRHENLTKYKDYFVSRADTMYLKKVYCEEFGIEYSDKKDNLRGEIERVGLSCSAGKSSCAIHWNGVVTPCLNYPEKNIASHIGIGFDKAFSYLYGEVINVQRPKQCFECEERTVCNYCPAYNDSDCKPNKLLCEYWKNTERGRQLDAEKIQI